MIMAAYLNQALFENVIDIHQLSKHPFIKSISVTKINDWKLCYLPLITCN